MILLVHDVLPGSAIGMVYEDAEKLYAEVAKDGKALFDEAVGAYLAEMIPLSHYIQKSKSPHVNGRITALNTLHFSRREVVEIPLVGPSATKLRSEVIQISKDGSKAYALLEGHKDTAGLLWAKGMYADVQPASGTYAYSLMI